MCIRDSVYASFRSPRSIPGLGGAFTNRDIAGGGVLIDWGVHFLDLVMYCCGDPQPKTVSGKGDVYKRQARCRTNMRIEPFEGQNWQEQD